MSKGVEAAPPILILCATARDHNRKGCTTKPDDEGGTGFWDCCEKLWETAASKRQPSRKLNKSASFYVGNAAGRFRDHSDCDKYLVCTSLNATARSMSLMFDTLLLSKGEASRNSLLHRDGVFCPKRY